MPFFSSRNANAYSAAVTSVIIGTRTMEQLADNLGAVDVALDAGDLAALDAVSALAPEYPGWMVDRQGMDRRGQV